MSKDSWLKHFTDQSRSGMSVKSYCKKHGLLNSGWYYWQKKLARGTAYPVTMLAPPSRSIIIEVDGIKLEIKGKRDAKTVAKLIATLLEG